MADEKPKFDLTDEQKNCIDAVYGPLLVSAAAGSGKTRVLIERIKAKVLSGRYSLSRLLVCTFTKAAAEEMRMRLHAALNKALHDEKTTVETKQIIRRQLMLLPQAAIGTIDSFLARFVRDHFEAAGVSPQFRILDEGMKAAMEQEVAEEVIEEYYSKKTREFESLALLLYQGNKDDELIRTLLQLYEYSRSFPDPEAWLNGLINAYDADLPMNKSPWFRPYLDSLIDKVLKTQLLIEDLIVRTGTGTLHDNLTPALQKDYELCDEIISQLHCENLAPFFGEKPVFAGIARLTQEQKLEVDDDLRENIIKVRNKTIKEKIKDIYAALQELEPVAYRQRIETLRPYVELLVEITKRFTVLINERKKTRDLYYFDDITLMALNLLGERQTDGSYKQTALAKSMYDGYDEIMIDEYQDNNEAQDTLFSLLGGDKLFMVGDVKQSIYSFRQASPDAFLAKRQTYTPYDGQKHSTCISLKKNFRSRPQVTDAVNFLSSQLMRIDTCKIDYKSEALIPHRTENDDAYAAELWMLKKDGDLPVAPRAVAAEIYRMTHSEPKDGEKAPQYSDFCILFRKGDVAVSYARELNNRGIPTHLMNDQNILKTEEVQTVLAWLRYINNPRQDVALVSVLTSDCCGFTMDDLAAIRKLAPKVNFSTALGRMAEKADALGMRCRDFLGRVAEYRVIAGCRTVAKLMETLYETEGLPAIATAREGGKQRMANLYLLLQYARDFDQNGLRGLSAFIRYIDTVQSSEKKLKAASYSGENAVTLMTIHGSKGLERPYVFLVNVERQFNTKDENEKILLSKDGIGLKSFDLDAMMMEDTVMRMGIRSRIRREKIAEELRILYVATTRAQEKLYIVGTYADPAETLNDVRKSIGSGELPSHFVRNGKSFSEWIIGAMLHHPDADNLRSIADVTEICQHPAEQRFIIRIDEKSVEPPQIQNNDGEAVIADQDAVNAAVKQFGFTYEKADIASIPVKAAASSLAEGHHGDDIGAAKPAFLTDEKLTPAERGTALHEFMQYADFARAEADADAEADRLVAMGLLRSKERECLDIDKIRRFLASDVYRRMKQSPNCLREYPFNVLYPVEEVAEYAHLKGCGETMVVKGIADCIFEEDGGIVIVDYKTDHVKSVDVLAKRYAGQMKIYGYALTRIFGKPLKSCLLYSIALSEAVEVPV